jgi:hypothetical protein
MAALLSLARATLTLAAGKNLFQRHIAIQGPTRLIVYASVVSIDFELGLTDCQQVCASVCALGLKRDMAVQALNAC